MNQAAIIRLAPVMTATEYADRNRERRDMYYHGSFRPLHQETPLIVNHDKDRVVGVVREFAYREDPATRGMWVFAHCHVHEDAPDWLGKGTRCSFGYVPFSTRRMEGGWDVIWDLGVREVSVLSPDRQPYEELAKVEWIGDCPVTRKPAVGIAHGPAAGVAAQLNPGLIRRYYETTITVR